MVRTCFVEILQLQWRGEQREEMLGRDGSILFWLWLRKWETGNRNVPCRKSIAYERTLYSISTGIPEMKNPSGDKR
jgi:hypothetical protein